MKNAKSILLGLAFVVAAIILEFVWIGTGTISFGVLTLIAALAASLVLEQYIRKTLPDSRA